MAVKKSIKKELEADTTLEVEVNSELEVTPDVVEVEDDNKGLEVDTTPVADEPKVKGNVRIRMNQNHHCYIGGENYNLVAGQCYNVPENVKNILNKAGLLSPL